MSSMPLGLFSAAGTPSLSKSSSSSSVSLQPASFRPFNVKLRTSVTYATASEPATETKKRAPRGFSKPRPVSPEMREFLGGRTEIPRTEVLKVIWAHIKENGLQDPNNKRVIVCDEKLKKIFGEKEQVGFLEIAGLISPHFKKVEN
ncbi:putative transcription regulator SWI/SNF-BAF60b family [Helianthus annuus]|nr:putative transcription regulator SWI/SNF-BAF60b family [Helianthus annuus]KAJ0640175.1 putative transcription regulator SWI/SNF-BAF60b family [Helianthus annuus]KAJ0644130.1 putative transcription regulator SWI/SNF-BAF60b family [Helianthus annuus]KAJ0820372.1 putative transcription regulator SWI/SNF-BAF60b family [Helianthus annuus]KAJ0834981.1 putative transcription regulator SWI/SNF-BAF60b family [Helianthus annuus]